VRSQHEKIAARAKNEKHGVTLQRAMRPYMQEPASNNLRTVTLLDEAPIGFAYSKVGLGVRTQAIGCVWVFRSLVARDGAVIAAQMQRHGPLLLQVLSEPTVRASDG